MVVGYPCSSFGTDVQAAWAHAQELSRQLHEERRRRTIAEHKLQLMRQRFVKLHRTLQTTVQLLNVKERGAILGLYTMAKKPRMPSC